MPLNCTAWRIIPSSEGNPLLLSIGPCDGPLEGSARLPTHTSFGEEIGKLEVIICGFWDEEARKITFATESSTSVAPARRRRIYTGYLHNTNSVISGHYEDFSRGAGRVVSGWCGFDALSKTDFSFFPRREVEESPLPTGVWRIYANGHGGDLNLSLSGANVSGRALGDSISGLWDDASKKIAFVRQPPTGAAPDSEQFYTGYYFANRGTDFLAGSFEAFSGTGGTAVRVTYGWYAYKIR